MRMRWILAVPLLLVCLSMTSCTQAPDSMALVSGKEIDIKALKGKWVFINYWADWCKPCIKEIPELNHFARENGLKVRVLGVNYDGLTGQDLSAQVDKMAIGFDVFEQDPALQLGFERPTVLPATYVLAPDGQLSGVLLGPQTSDSLRAVIEPSVNPGEEPSANPGQEPSANPGDRNHDN